MEEANSSDEMLENKTAAIVSDDDVIKMRKEKLLAFLKEKYNWITYVILAAIVFLAVRIRTSNLKGLRDITTGKWALGPDLDPWFFLRMAKYIVDHGSLFQVDMMRYVPIGFDVSGEYLLHPYMMAWFHKLATVFGSVSVTQSGAIYPVFMFALTVVAFFFMTREIFVKKFGILYANVIALISSFFLVVAPALLPRTIAGIPEKESAAFLFLFLAFYFFMAGWNSKGKRSRWINSILAGLSTAGMAHIWGGYIFIFLTIVPAIFFAFLLGKMDRDKTVLYSVWLVTSFVFMIIPFARHTLRGVIRSTASGPAVGLLVILLVHFLIYDTKLKKKVSSEKLSKIPPKVISLVVSLVLMIVVISAVFGASFIPNQISSILGTLIKPAASRLIQTVAENKQPFFSEWAGSFGPVYLGIPLTFWLFFLGSVYLFRDAVKILKAKERRWLLLSYVAMLFTVIFSRYSGGSLLNGENTVSKVVYAGGFVFFIVIFGWVYYKRYLWGSLDKLKEVSFGFLLLFSLFFISIIAARAAVRTIMVLVPSASIITGYFIIATFRDSKKIEKKENRLIAFGFVGLIILTSIFAGYGFYDDVRSQAQSYAPTVYNQQWQKAMAWVRENTPQDAVFGHWWDYGYWLQSIGDRATVLDGGNAVSYWNHLMGRYALTGTSDQEDLEFLYAHNTTHFLIDSTDIGKYGAFSTIGSDVSYDRASYIGTMLRDPNQVQEKKNSTVFVYTGGIALDEDIVYDDDGRRVFLPAGSAGIGAVLVERNAEGILMNQPSGIFIYQGEQFELPIRYAFDKEFIDFGSGIDSGVYLFPRAVQSNGQLQLDERGALLYLSKRTVKSQLARLYLYKEDNPHFRLAHSEDDFLVAQIKDQNPSFDDDLVYFQGIRGPIRIWEINYPAGIEYKEEFIDTEYPEELRIGR